MKKRKKRESGSDLCIRKHRRERGERVCERRKKKKEKGKNKKIKMLF